jgi:hypothetical protein
MRRLPGPEHEWSEPTVSRAFNGLPALELFGLGVAVRLLSFHWLWGRWKNKSEARTELRRIVAEHEGQDYESWRNVVDRTRRFEFRTDQGNWYQASITPVWDHKAGGAIRVLFSLDDGGSSAFFPMSASLLVEAPTSVPRRAVQQ